MAWLYIAVVAHEGDATLGQGCHSLSIQEGGAAVAATVVSGRRGRWVDEVRNLGPDKRCSEQYGKI